jgi:hypothetical protein
MAYITRSLRTSPSTSSFGLVLAVVISTILFASFPNPTSAWITFYDSQEYGWTPLSPAKLAGPYRRGSPCTSCDPWTEMFGSRAAMWASQRTPGVLYFASTRDNVVLAVNFNITVAGAMISSPPLVIWTLAGNSGTTGYAGDGGQANASTVRLDNPIALVEDNAGNIFINDYGNRKIRLVNSSTGGISTYADTSFMRFPRSITVDTTTDTLYVSDLGTRVRNASQTTGDFFAVRGQERGAIYSVSSGGVFTLVAGGDNAQNAASAVGVGALTIKMFPQKIWYVQARHSLAWLDPLNAMVKEFDLASGTVRLLIGTQSGSANTTATTAVPVNRTVLVKPLAVSSSLAFGWGDSRAVNSAFSAGFGISRDGMNIVVGSRHWVVGAEIAGISPSSDNTGRLTHGMFATQTTYPVHGGGLLEDVVTDYDGEGIFTLVADEMPPHTGGQFPMNIYWLRTPTRDGFASVDTTGWGKSTICPSGTSSVSPNPSTCNFGGFGFNSRCRPGPTRCTTCPSLQFSAPGSSSCSRCLEGNEVTPNATGCRICPVNTFTTSDG